MPAPALAAPELPCSGCANCATETPYPGRPSGEWPCLHCTRNPERDEWVKNHQSSMHLSKFPEDIRAACGTYPIDFYKSLNAMMYHRSQVDKVRQQMEVLANGVFDAIVKVLGDSGMDALRVLDAKKRLGGP